MPMKETKACWYRCNNCDMPTGEYPYPALGFLGASLISDIIPFHLSPVEWWQDSPQS